MAQHSHSNPHHTHDVDWAAMVASTEREGEVLGAILSRATSRLAELAATSGLDVRRILDVGSGPGVATCELARRFSSAAVVAADATPEMLANVKSRAARLGVADRVETRLVELPDGITTLGTADLLWASLVLHHVGDEAAALRGLRSRLVPGGLMALVEFGDPMRVLPDGVDVGRPGLWERLDAAAASWLADMRAELPGTAASGDYRDMLVDAGFEVVTDEIVPVELPPPLDDRARQVASRHVQRLREHVEPYVDAADLEALDVLADDSTPEGISRRPDAFLRTSRRLLIGRAGEATP